MSPVAIPTQLAVVCHGPRDLHVEERVVWPPLNNQATVAVASTGLCGSDRALQNLFLLLLLLTLFLF